MGSRRVFTGALLFVLAASIAPARAGVDAKATALPRHHTIASVNANQSTNWAGYNQGYLEKGKMFHSVAGDWTVPTATRHTVGKAAASSTWVGIGGGCIDVNCLLTDSTLIQAGTESDVAANGQATYYAWWEIIPLPGLKIATVPVKPGDVIHCDITESLPELWTITLTNRTTNKTFTQTVPYASTYATAEWIVETPVSVGTDGAGVTAMPNLSRITFNNARTNGAAANLVAVEALQLVVNNVVLATPSNPGTTKVKFSVCTYATTCPIP